MLNLWIWSYCTVIILLLLLLLLLIHILRSYLLLAYYLCSVMFDYFIWYVRYLFWCRLLLLLFLIYVLIVIILVLLICKTWSILWQKLFPKNTTTSLLLMLILSYFSQTTLILSTYLLWIAKVLRFLNVNLFVIRRFNIAFKPSI